MDIRNLSDFRKAMRHGPYAWPGGYPCFFWTSDGEALSFDSVKKNLRPIIESIAHRSNDGWRVFALDVNWENDELYCAHSGERIESAYGEKEGD
jgi:hypothetical protein